MALSLVADYESSSSDSEYEHISTSKEVSTVQLAPALEMLNDNNPNISSSVFSNPYREAENYEQSILERHVKMTSIKEAETEKPKKICYKFNKGNCKLGDNCRFLHHNSSIRIDETNHSDSDHQTAGENNDKRFKKRCGLKDDLVPPKKFMKMYKS